MAKKSFESILAYRIMKEFGDEEIVAKIEHMVDKYIEAVISKTNLDKYEFREVNWEDDEREVDKFKKFVLTHNGTRVCQQLEVYTDFSTDHSLFRFTLKNKSFPIVRLVEYPANIVGDRQRDLIYYTINAIKTDEASKPTITSKIEDVYKGKKMETKVVTNADLTSIEKEKSEESENL